MGITLTIINHLNMITFLDKINFFSKKPWAGSLNHLVVSQIEESQRWATATTKKHWSLKDLQLGVARLLATLNKISIFK